MKPYTVDVIIPTYKPDETFHRLMQMLEKQNYPVNRILIMNTEESCFPRRGYEKLPKVEIRHLKRSEFDHGGTRDRAARCATGELLCFLTQDAVPEDENLIGRLAEAFSDPGVMAAYARQLAAPGCHTIEQYTRSFNYPDKSRVKSAEDLKECGIKTFFCSNVCAMYRAEAYLRLGGFEQRTIFNEDMILAGKMILNGGKIAYVAQARVIHSHNYTPIQQLHRNFDLAVSQADHPEIFGMVKSESEGIRLVSQTARYLCRIRKPWLVPALAVQSGCKFLGYRLGKRYRRLPSWLIRRLTMNRAYWGFK